jgi:hypothetical protein
MELVSTHTDLTKVFTLDEKRINNVGFRAQDVVALVSTVGMNLIKARFVLTEENLFSLVLVACDADGSPLSAYLLGAPRTEAVGIDSGHEGQDVIPDLLAKTWMGDWTTSTEEQVSQQNFAYHNSFLQGYTFQSRDFIDFLFSVKTITEWDYDVWVNFAIHQWYNPNSTNINQTEATFGVVLSLVDRGAGVFRSGFYDLSTPCPPTC